MARRPSVIVPTVEYTPEQVWAAAVAATRILGGYVKYEEVADVGPVRPRNREIMYRTLADNSAIPEDFAKGEDIRTHYKGLLLKQLASIPMNSFEASTLQVASKDQFTNKDFYDFAIMASLPAAYERSVKREVAKEEMSFLLEKSSHIGYIGDKVELTVRVVKSVFSTNYGINFITAIADEKDVVFFANKNNFDTGAILKISGRVKQHRDQGQTQLNRVKVK